MTKNTIKTASAKALKVLGLNKSFHLTTGRSVPAVRDFNLNLAPGELVTLLGPSGCGKTTVLRALAGLEELDEGEILLDGYSIANLPPHRRRMGFVFQNYALFPHMTVLENVAYSLRIRRSPDAEVRAKVASALLAVGLENLGPRLPGQLSGGQQQRVAVARALVMKPDLLLFDEPLSSLDTKLRVQVRAELRRLQKSLGTTTLYVTHDQDEAMSLSDRIAVMRAGKVEQVGTPEEIYARPASLFVAEFVGKVNALPGRVEGSSNGRSTVEILGHRIQVPTDRIPAAQVLVLVRPEAIRLCPPSAERPAGRVEETEYLGDRIEYRIRVGTTLIVAAQSALGGASRVAESDTVGLEFVEDAIHLLPFEGPA